MELAAAHKSEAISWPVSFHGKTHVELKIDQLERISVDTKEGSGHQPKNGNGEPVFKNMKKGIHTIS